MPVFVNSEAVGLPSQGGTGDANKIHLQAIPEAVWVINHTLNKYPSVTVVDSAGSLVVGDVEYDSPSQVTVRFAAAFSGKAFLN